MLLKEKYRSSRDEPYVVACNRKYKYKDVIQKLKEERTIHHSRKRKQDKVFLRYEDTEGYQTLDYSSCTP